MQELLAKLSTLITEIHNNTAAINNLAAIMISDHEIEDESEEEVIKTYLDGTPIAG
jgi:hypothetical protein